MINYNTIDQKNSYIFFKRSIFYKRLFDLCLGIFGLIITTPIIILMCCAILIDSPGNPFFSQTRVGKNGKYFTIYKMRTLYIEHFGIIPNEESPSDHRITRIGKFLRSSKLDEIPQLLNVLIGDMSIVGPRPDIPEQREKYTALQNQRLLVKPGMTGIAQISGNTLLPWPHRIALDIWYIQNWSHIVDCKIIFYTFKTVINNKITMTDPFNLNLKLLKNTENLQTNINSINFILRLDMQKRILFLGGSYFQLPPILYARKQGHYVITCDYLPQNPGHQYADAYYNISTTDKDSVLLLAQNLGIDGVVAFASDPAAPTAAYVADKLKLPGNPFQSTLLLTRKDLFREFLREHQFKTPAAASFSNIETAREYFEAINQPMMVKPVDSSGSKGVSKVIKADHLKRAFEHALSFSRTGKVILEEFIIRNGYQIAGDGFVVDGRLVFKCFGQEHFNNRGNPFVPVGESFPLQLSEAIQLKIHNEIQRLLILLKMNSGAINFDIILNQKEEIYLLEVGPRGGGNLISEVIKHTTGIDLAKLVVDAALGLGYVEKAPYKSQPCHSCYMLHSLENGFLKEIDYDDSICKNIIEKMVFVKNGDFIQSFDGSNHTLGYLILKFNSPKEMLDKMASMHKKIKIHISRFRHKN